MFNVQHGVYDVEGDFVLNTSLNFVNKAITRQAQMSSMIPLHQFLRVEDLYYDDVTQTVTFNCKLYGYLLN